jgi:hypothetical protein
MNALKHGMTARIPVLPGEDAETFRQHVEGIVDSLAPRNGLELALGELVALSLWKIERAERVEAARAAATLGAAEAKAEAHRQEELAATGRWLLSNTVKTKREAADDLLRSSPRTATLPSGPAGASRWRSSSASRRPPTVAGGCSTAGTSSATAWNRPGAGTSRR